MALLSLLFLAPRLALLFARDPFYDELFTLWIAPQGAGAILDALQRDSGPPLYYLAVHFLGLRSIIALRLFSLACAAAAWGLILSARWLGTARFTAAALLAAYPPAALFAADARSYALAGLFIAAGVLALDRGKTWPAAGAFVLAAWTHFYGVLFFPLLLLRRPARGVPPFLAAVALFAPGLRLASIQPPEAMGWLAQTQSAGWHLAALANLSFAGAYPASLFPPLPAALVVAALVALVFALARSIRFSAAVIVPVALAIVFGLAGRSVYFPMRFESVVAVPLALWAGHALTRWKPRIRGAIGATLIAIGVGSILVGVVDHLRRPLDPYREAALLIRRAAPADATVVASGYCYLETLMNARRRVVPFPPEQGRHPGWRERVTAAEAVRLAESNLPPGTFFYVGETIAPEWRAVRQVRRTQVLIENPRVVVARVRARATLH